MPRFHAVVPRLPVLLSTAVWLASAARADIDPKNFDPAVKPQDDFYQHANGGWIKANPVPPAYSTWGSFNEVDEHNKVVLHAILERAAQAQKADSIQKLVGDFYASGMDLPAIDAAGIAPLQPDLAAIAAAKTGADIQALVASFHRRGLPAGFGFGSEQDPGNPALTIASVGQGGLGLPERDYYFRDDEKSKQLREQYVAHVAKMLQLAGETPAAAQAGAAAVMKIETALAKGSKPVAELRDPVANYHKLPLAEVKKLAPDFDWPGYFKGIGLADAGDIDVGQPEFLQAFNALVGGEPVVSWQAYLRWHLVHGTAAYLSTPLIEENFAFYGKILTGRKTLRDRWKRVLDMTDGAVGEALGQLYVADNFPAASKARVLQLVANLRAVLRERLQTLDWMDEPTRTAALKKIDAFGVKIGYPDKWIDYRSLTLDRGPFVLNVLRADAFNVRRDLAKIGKPFDRTEWLMAPQEINAYYNPTMNEIVFPAGILQPPFFDAAADDAVNYGAIGMVIGHEMTHGFDDQGRQFGADGTLKDWWTEESAKRFAERSKAIVAQYSAYTVVDDLKLNGELSQGENIADLGGLKIAFTALQRTFGGRPQPKIGGFTPEQRFFLSYANAWRANWRPEMIRLVANSDPHPPPQIRVNGPLSNLPEFAEAFAIPEGSPLRRPAAERVVIW